MAEGYIYTIKLFRSVQDDDVEQLGTDRTPIAQVSAELQEAMDDTGLPCGFFKITDRQESTWSEWDSVVHKTH